MQTLIPTPVGANATYSGRHGRVFGFVLTPTALWLLAAGVLLAVPAFFLPRLLWMMPAWDAIILALALFDAFRLPPPRFIHIERRFEHAPALGNETTVTLTLQQSGAYPLSVTVLNSLNPSITVTPASRQFIAFPYEAVAVTARCWPSVRGDVKLSRLYLRYRSSIALAERWASAPLEQTIRVLPLSISSSSESMFLLRARQIELEKRRLRNPGIGREFESLREYQPGDELRNISWTATARRGKPITRTFTTERSQQVWVVLDSGRLSRTTHELVLPGLKREQGRGDYRFGEDDRLEVTQLDQACSAAMLVSQVVDQSGDRSGLIVYGRSIQQQLLPGKGAIHLRHMLDALSRARSEGAEADHRLAAARLRQMQGRRGLVFWITEMAESASAPEVSVAVADLARRHLVVLVLLKHPELEVFAHSTPTNSSQMFAITAANEMLERRRRIVAHLRSKGILILETSVSDIGVAAVNQYLEIKARGSL